MGATAIFGPAEGRRGRTTSAAIDATLARFAQPRRGRVRARSPRSSRGPAPRAGSASRSSSWAARSARVPRWWPSSIGLDAALDGADWAITGEGRSDRQTLLAKAPFVVAQHARRAASRSPCCPARSMPPRWPTLGRHFAGCFGLPDGPMTLAECIADAARLLETGRSSSAGCSGTAKRPRPLCEIIAPPLSKKRARRARTWRAHPG